MRTKDVTLKDFVGMMFLGPLLALRLGLIASGLHNRKWYR